MAAPLRGPYITAGQTFARLTALEDAAFSADKVLFRCSCGREKVLLAARVHQGHTRSCGCLHRDVARGNAAKATAANRAAEVYPTTRHGLSGTPEYGAWLNMISRCTNPQSAAWDNYGARGIGVTARWLGPEGLRRFVDDMGPRPSPGHSLHRVNNALGYSPANCVWATRAEQNAPGSRRQPVRHADVDALADDVGALRAEVARLRAVVDRLITASERPWFRTGADPPDHPLNRPPPAKM